MGLELAKQAVRNGSGLIDRRALGKDGVLKSALQQALEEVLAGNQRHKIENRSNTITQFQPHSYT